MNVLEGKIMKDAKTRSAFVALLLLIVGVVLKLIVGFELLK
jgi:hypothetical protein